MSKTMSNQKNVPESAIPALYVGTVILSMISAILMFADEFGWWRGGYSWGYSFAIWGEFVPWYGKLAIGLLGLGFLYVAVIAVQKLYPLFSISEGTEKKLEMSAFYTAIGLVVLTIIMAIGFSIEVSEARDWDFGSGFYAGLFGGGLCAFFLWIARKAQQASTSNELKALK